ncbi:hypothetical protein J6590_104448, partial [Homalodisca vitripennis]
MVDIIKILHVGSKFCVVIGKYGVRVPTQSITSSGNHRHQSRRWRAEPAEWRDAADLWDG